MYLYCIIKVYLEVRIKNGIEKQAEKCIIQIFLCLLTLMMIFTIVDYIVLGHRTFGALNT